MPKLIACLFVAVFLIQNAMAGAKETFAKSCAPCHGKDGKGNTPAGRKIGAKDLTISKSPAADVLKQISQGRTEPNGVVKMPAFAGKMTAAEIGELTEYVLSLRR